MLLYDGKKFYQTQKMEMLFIGMDEEEQVSWIKNCSVVVDYIYAALGNSGIVTKDVVI